MEEKRNYFYKYYSIDSGILTLKDTMIKWSNPKEFNDPFDNQFNIKYVGTIEEAENETKKFIINCILENKPIPDFLPVKNSMQMQIMQSISKEKFKQVIPRIMSIKNIYPPNFIEDQQKAFNIGFRNIMSDSSMFCLTEEKDNLLMWAHYANNHTGIVIKFRNIPDGDSPIQLAQKVAYTNKIPEVPISKFIRNEFTIDTLHQIYTLTKSKEWAYEKEWRIVTTLRNKTKSFEILPFVKEEVAAVYLGCKINSTSKDTVVKIIKSKYPWAEIYQANKDSCEFKLIFNKID